MRASPTARSSLMRRASVRSLDEPAVQAPVVRQLRVERHREDLALTHGDRMTVDLGQNLDLVTCVVHPGRSNEDSSQRAAESGQLQVRLEASELAAEGVAACVDVQQSEVPAIEHDHARAGAQDGLSAPHEAAQRLAEPL